MPELPDVEGFRRMLAAHLSGRRVERVRVLDLGVLHDTTPAALGRRLHGHRFGATERYGKWLVLPTDAGSLVLHNGMTGRPYLATQNTPADRFDRLIIILDKGELRYADQRKLQGVWFLPAGGDLTGITGPLGFDALAITRRQFRDVLDRPAPLKAVLVEQSRIGGLGNTLGDEICWRARINPLVAARSVDESGLDSLYEAIQAVLSAAVELGSIPRSPDWLSSVRGSADAECPRCRTKLHRGRVRQRTTAWCPHCQPE